MKSTKRPGASETPSIEVRLDTAQILLVVTALAGLCGTSFLFGKWVERDRWRESAAKSDAKTGKLSSADAGADLTFFDTLGSKTAEPSRQTAPTMPAASPAPVSAPANTTDRPEAPGPVHEQRGSGGPTAGSPPSSTPTGFALQVFAGDRAQAEKLLATLARKGYMAKLMAGTTGPQSARVRVYGFRTRSEADRGAARLKREEKLRPWVVKPD